MFNTIYGLLIGWAFLWGNTQIVSVSLFPFQSPFPTWEPYFSLSGFSGMGIFHLRRSSIWVSCKGPICLWQFGTSGPRVGVYLQHPSCSDQLVLLSSHGQHRPVSSGEGHKSHLLLGHHHFPSDYHPSLYQALLSKRASFSFHRLCRCAYLVLVEPRGDH